jgi:ABC-type multidrug transport system permease subunit
MNVTVPKESGPGERRVAITPESAQKLRATGVDVIVEAGAGAGAFHSDKAYQDAGATIVADPAAVWSGANVVAKIQPPLPHPTLGRDEAELLPEGSVLACMLRPLSNLDTVRTLARRKVSSFSMDLVPRVYFNPDLRSRWFYVPAVVAMVLMLVTMILPSMAVVREKEIGTLEQIIVTPLRSWQLIMGKLAPFVVIGLLDMLLVTGVARFLFGVPLRGSLLLLTLLTLLFLLSTLGFGLLVSTLVGTQQQAMMFSAFVLMVPMIYLSGLIFPISNMPPLFQAASVVIPVRYYAVILRGVFLKGSGLDVLWPQALALLAIGTTVIALAALRFRKSLD